MPADPAARRGAADVPRAAQGMKKDRMAAQPFKPEPGGAGKVSLAQRAEYAMALGMRFLPIDWVSALGGYLGRRYVRRAQHLGRRWVSRLLGNLDDLKGEADQAQRQQRLLDYGDQVGRVYTEMTVLKRLIDAPRYRVEGEHHLRGLDGPLIMVAPHLANWELVPGIVMGLIDKPLVDLFEARESELRMRIAMRSRQSLEGVAIEWVPTDSAMAMRRVKAYLLRGHHAMLFCDEIRQGVSQGPSLGRELPYTGNRWMAARLAVQHDATIVPMHIEREVGAHFTLHIASPLVARAYADPNTEARDLADQIDNLFDGWVRQHPEHWYWLKDVSLG